MTLSVRDTRGILDDVVHQFSDPMAFVRELVQNSIDAGSRSIEIDCVHGAQDDDNLAVISFRDWGEGMTRQIIDGELLRLFSSGKDDDFTKIGRFGIGFVSVFAIEPDAVVVDTGREGEYWRILFAEDRNYELFSLDGPVEGTWVRIYKSMDVETFVEMKDDLEGALRKWCKHAGIPILFEGFDIRQEVRLASQLTTIYQEEGTEIVMGFSGRDHGLAGYYNRGLTLKESVRSPWPWVCFKIDSRYLEHTLTRDQVLEDRHFSKAMDLLAELAEEVLPEKLIDELEELVQNQAPVEELDVYYGYLAHFLSCDQSFERSWRRRKIFRGAGEEQWTFRQVRRAHRRGRLRVTKLDGETAALFDEEGVEIVIGDDGLKKLLKQLFGEAPREVESLVLAVVRAQCDGTYETLRCAVRDLVANTHFEVDEVLIVSGDALPAKMRGVAATIVPTTDGVISSSTWRRVDCAEIEKCLCPGSTLVVDADAAQLGPFAALVEREPEWAAVALIESLFAIGDEALWGRAIAERKRRGNSHVHR